MSRKLTVVILALVVASAAAIPVVAGERAATPRVKALSKQAAKKARKALRSARQAKQLARRALNDAAGAEIASGNAVKQAANAAGTANEAKAGVAAVQGAVTSTQVRSATAAGEVSTSSSAFVSLSGGPTVTVTVPASATPNRGLIEVWAQATIEGDGAVSLYEDGEPVPGQTELCSPEEGVGALFSEPAAEEPITIGTPASFGVACGTLGAPGPVLFETTPGPHTYELRYASCGCEDPAESATFSERRLYIGPRL